MAINIKNPPGVICIGRKGENGVMDIPFDMAAWYALWPDISIAVFHKRPGEMQAYPVAIERKGESVEWTVSAADTAISGRGSLEILGTVEDKRKLSAVMTTYISDSILDNTGDAPDPVRPWVDEVLDAADRAEEAAKRAESAGGGSVTPEQIQQAVDRYLSEHPVEIEESDPTVPAWAKQPEKPKYTADDVGAASKEEVERISEKKADKLNTPVFIDKIIVEEDVNSIYVTKEPDGTPYSFKKMVVLIKAKPGTKGNWSLFPFTINKEPSEPDITIQSFPDTSSTYYGMFVAEVYDGFISMTGYKGSHPTVLTSTFSAKQEVVSSPINLVDIRTSYGIYTGSEIEIWAVRA